MYFTLSTLTWNTLAEWRPLKSILLIKRATFQRLYSQKLKGVWIFNKNEWLRRELAYDFVHNYASSQNLATKTAKKGEAKKILLSEADTKALTESQSWTATNFSNFGFHSFESSLGLAYNNKLMTSQNKTFYQKNKIVNRTFLYDNFWKKTLIIVYPTEPKRKRGRRRKEVFEVKRCIKIPD